jgi:hypothetical protein
MKDSQLATIVVQSLEDKINQMALDIEQLKAVLIPKPEFQGCQHEYPQNWNSTALPSCIKCNKQYVYQGR